jgi:uncharacterized protein YeaO (DUF488 family)
LGSKREIEKRIAIRKKTIPFSEEPKAMGKTPTWRRRLRLLAKRGNTIFVNDIHGAAMPIKTKRWNDPRKKTDGFRLLICRYRPRALKKADETWDEWVKDLGPSKELHADFYGKNGPPITWETYKERYLREMEEQKEYINDLAELVAEGRTITLLCSSACTDGSHCHRSLLRHLIEEKCKDLPVKS